MIGTGWIAGSRTNTLIFFINQLLIIELFILFVAPKLLANPFMDALGKRFGQTIRQRYREGRTILTAEGRPVKETDHRLMRAIGKKTAFGAEVSHTSWLMYEYTTLEKLHAAGAAVPKPYGVSGNAILMEYIGDEQLAAPLLSEVRLERHEAWPLFEELIRNIELMLSLGLVHGDLSAYNVLYWDGDITLIDFPQVTDARTNPNARAIFDRDVQRLCEYFTRYGIQRNAGGLANALWGQFWRVAEADVLADLSRLDADSEDSDE